MHSQPPTLSPESELVIRSTALPTTRSHGELSSLLPRVADWTSVLTLAQRHGVLAPLHRTLHEELWIGVPPHVADVLKRWNARMTTRQERLRAERDRLLDVFAACGIAVVPLRCARLGSSGLEQIELDLLVRRRDVGAATGVLISHGLEPETSLGPERTALLVATHSARRFLHPGSYVVSLQWEVADASVAHGASADEMWERAALAELAGRPCSTLERADLLQLLCVRGTVKRWHRLAWVREVADLMVEADPRELEDALTRATRRGARRALALGSSLAGRMLGAPLPLGFADAARDGAVVELGTAVIEETAAAARALPGPSHIARFHLRTRERVSDKLRYAIRRATLPGPDAASALRVPAPLLPFAYALTSVRRVVRAGRQWRLRTRRRRGGKLARFGRTPAHVVDRMLALAGASEADTVFDLGCGDGAIVIRAAQRLGCRGVGVELDAELIEAARVNAREAGVERLVEFHRADVREMDLGAATIVCVYLNAAANLTLRPLLQRGLRPGTRLVSFNFTMGDWWPDEVEILDETSWGSNTLYLWHIDPDTAARAAA